jgi:hypothetical protein
LRFSLPLEKKKPWRLSAASSRGRGFRVNTSNLSAEMILPSLSIDSFILSFDESTFLDNQFSSKPAGPLSKDTLSHGGSFFAQGGSL